MPRNSALLLLLPTMLLSAGCATDSTLSPVPQAPLIVSKQLILPALPPSARQPAPPVACSLTCSAGVASAQESWLDTLMTLTPQGSDASGPMTPPAKQ